MKHLTLNGHTILAVEMPNDARDIELYDIQNSIVYRVGQGTEDFDILREPLPEGEWQLLGRPSQVTEDQARGLVGHLTLMGERTDAFENYGFGLPKYKTATESFLSWCRREGVDDNFVLLIKK